MFLMLGWRWPVISKYGITLLDNESFMSTMFDLCGVTDGFVLAGLSRIYIAVDTDYRGILRDFSFGRVSGINLRSRQRLAYISIPRACASVKLKSSSLK